MSLATYPPVYLPLYLSNSLSIGLSIYVSLALSFSLSIFPSIYLISLHRLMYLSMHFAAFLLCICRLWLPIYLSFYRSLSLSSFYPSSIYLSTWQKGCAFRTHQMCSWPCETVALATKSSVGPAAKPVPDLAKVRSLPRNLYLTLRKC